MSEALMRGALSVAFATEPRRRQQLFSFLPPATFRGPALYYNLARFFTKDTETEDWVEVAKGAGLDPVSVAELMVEDETLRPLPEHLIRLLAERQTAALAGGQDVTQWAAAITRLSEVALAGKQSAGADNESAKPFFISAIGMLTEPVEIRPLLGKVIERGCTGQLFGPSGGGKTFVALDMSLAVGTGGEWSGNRCDRGVVLYFAGEGTPG